MRVSRRVFLGAVAAAPVLTSSNRTGARCSIVDLGCVLPESLAGFKTQVWDLRGDVLIVPAVRSVTEAGKEMIQRWLDHGATVLLEYVAGKSIEQDAYFPYVEYFWPARCKIREFSPVKLTPVPGDEIIATFVGQPVGLRRKVGAGTLVVIGSALGPVFLAGDPDARRWLDGLHTA
jgi:hypothetical protein